MSFAHVVEVEACPIGWGSVNVLYYHSNIIIALVDVFYLNYYAVIHDQFGVLCSRHLQ